MPDDVVDELIRELSEELAGTVSGPASLDEHTTLKVGGPAMVLVEPASDADLAVVGRLTAAHGVPWTVIGRGSNLLVADTGFPGAVIVLGRAHRGIEIQGTTVRTGAAEPMPSLARALADEGLAGMAWAAGVPGTVGGGVRMNAGAHGGEMVDHLRDVAVMRMRSGTQETWPVEALGMRYRHADLPDDAVVVAATFELDEADPDQVRAEVEQVRAWRREHQPINQPNCGSVFTNPPDDSAGRLLDDVGAKSLVVGGARVSSLHANFIVTEPGATAADVRTLIGRMQQLVLQRHGIELRPEVTMIGTFDDEAGW